MNNHILIAKKRVKSYELRLMKKDNYDRNKRHINNTKWYAASPTLVAAYLEEHPEDAALLAAEQLPKTTAAPAIKTPVAPATTTVANLEKQVKKKKITQPKESQPVETKDK